MYIDIGGASVSMCFFYSDYFHAWISFIMSISMYAYAYL